ncbi:myomodulin neuropeptides [Plakobranchus ocellatus]|uniref:Myomodulin neuropeptides n=1 Tax=Plakobranchus ocellatus TaxID=259542 RepID=A0AAV3YZ02_9GAST|nr:myomodulin neuropeptides [Plakobranchus ocellatus]
MVEEIKSAYDAYNDSIQPSELDQDDSDHYTTLPSELGVNEANNQRSCQSAPSHPSEMTYHNKRPRSSNKDSDHCITLPSELGLNHAISHPSEMTLNMSCQEVFKNAGSRARYRDTSLQGVQKSLLKGLTAVALVFDKLAKTIREDEVVEQLSDGVALLANASHRLDVFRHQSFQGEFKGEYNSLCQASYPVTGSLFGPSVQEKIKEVQESLKVARSTRRFQAFKQGTHGKRFPFLGQRQRWKQRGGGNMPQNNTQRNPWHQQKKGFQKRK